MSSSGSDRAAALLRTQINEAETNGSEYVRRLEQAFLHPKRDEQLISFLLHQLQYVHHKEESLRQQLRVEQIRHSSTDLGHHDQLAGQECPAGSADVDFREAPLQEPQAFKFGVPDRRANANANSCGSSSLHAYAQHETATATAAAETPIARELNHPAAGVRAVTAECSGNSGSPQTDHDVHITCFASSILTRPLPVFSHVTNFRGLLHVSCIQGFLPGTFEFPSDDAGAQAEQVLRNLQTVLEEAGSGLSQVLKLTLFFTNMKLDFPAVNEVVNRFFPVNPPARSSIGVAELPRNAKIVMECTAVALH